MALDDAGMPTRPNDLAELGRRVKQLQREIELMGGARTLSSASIGSGGLRVLDGGSITIEGSGSLHIETGDLILGAGKIQGSALASQLSSGYDSATASNFAVSTSWATKASRTITAPSWATTMLIHAYATANLTANGNDKHYDLNADMRLSIAGRISQEIVLPVFGASGKATGSLAHAAEVPAAGTASVMLQLRSHNTDVYRAATSQQARISIVTLYMR